MPLSKEAKKKKLLYNMRRNKELTSVFAGRLPKEEYNEICEYLKSVNMNKAEFIRWAFDKIRED